MVTKTTKPILKLVFSIIDTHLKKACTTVRWWTKRTDVMTNLTAYFEHIRVRYKINRLIYGGPKGSHRKH
ncbi:hypothetical protein Hanom_Chr06g00530921 [Helianthus anomalus]